MKTSVDRIKGFSDAFIAIIITLMILEISLPQTMNREELMTFFQSILIYGASFIIVGGQWYRHHRLIDELECVSNVFIWENMIYLFILSLIPLFMKWVIQFPSSVIPALGYSIVYHLNDLTMRILFFRLLREDRELALPGLAQREGFLLKHLMLLVLMIGIILALSFILPEISIVCFIIFPVVTSLKNLFAGGKSDDCGRARLIPRCYGSK